MAALRIRTSADSHAQELLFGVHDVGVILQYLWLIPVVFALQRLSRERSAEGLGRPIVAVGVAALSSTVALLLIGFFHFEWGPWYMVPQGVIGGWLMVISWRMAKVLPWSLRGLGLVVGLGLVFVGTVPLSYAVWVDPAVPESVANQIVHQIVTVGTFMGVPTFPVWSLLLGNRLLREKSA